MENIKLWYHQINNKILKPEKSENQNSNNNINSNINSNNNKF